ncbi:MULTISPECIES: putative polysaccharide biosynthesis protein [unclassified Bilifractor]|uniref:putative polysaccharide biosynthesis protein n=1 Tax=unclassified Bilifractor TaxID=2815795 RepID=UPI003F8EDDE2
MTEKNSNSLVKNASVLMIASIISRVIGLLYRRPLGSILGSVGLGYYGYASNLYSILLLISSYSIPMATSKIISEMLAKKEYRGAHKVFRGAMLYAVIVGGITALICFFGGAILLPQNQQNALPALRALAPTIFLSAILGVLRGYFQAHRTMTPTSISQILEQIMNAIVSILAAWILIRNLAPEGGTRAAIYGAMGGTIGTGAGVLVGLLFMTFVYMLNRGYFRRKIAHDRRSTEQSYQEILKMLVLMITPIIFTSFIYNCSAYADSYLYSAIQGFNGMSADSISAAYGEYSNYYVPIVSIPLAMASASTSAMMPEVSGKYAIGQLDELNRQVNQTLRLTMFICIPCMIGLTVLANPIMGVLFPSASELAEKLLFAGSVFVVTDSFSIVTGGVLQAIGKQHVALVNAGISLAVNLASLAVMLFARPGLDIYAVMLSNIIFSLVCCFLNILSMKKHLRTRHEIRKTYVEPLASSVIMGAVAWLIYTALFHLTRRPFIGLLVAILVAIVVYLVSYVVISKTTEEEMYRFPMGGRIVKFLRLIRIYH